jgi:ATP-dependent Clp protease adapter protein ClpS
MRATLPMIRSVSVHKLQKGPSHAVTLHNDEVTRKTKVVSALTKVVPSIETAVSIMEEAHRKGRARVVSGVSKEEAAGICAILTAEGLDVSFEL